MQINDESEQQEEQQPVAVPQFQPPLLPQNTMAPEDLNAMTGNNQGIEQAALATGMPAGFGANIEPPQIAGQEQPNFAEFQNDMAEDVAL